MQAAAWGQYVSLASEVMCAPFAEMIKKTKQPFVTAINDASCPRAVALDGKVILVGEALNLMRPHMALSATQCAVQALELEGVLKGETTMEQWNERVVREFRDISYPYPLNLRVSKSILKVPDHPEHLKPALKFEDWADIRFFWPVLTLPIGLLGPGQCFEDQRFWHLLPVRSFHRCRMAM